MMHGLMKRLDRLAKVPVASAHCDIPCKIYDPATAQIAALTVIRMQDLIAELASKDTLSIQDQAQLARLVVQKEEHAAAVKDEVRTIWGDYVKAPQLEAFPELHELTHKIMLQASSCKQHVDPATGVQLLGLVNRFAQIFWETKGVETYEAECPYPPAKTVVYPRLG